MKVAFDSQIFFYQTTGGISVHFSKIISFLTKYKNIKIFILIKKKEYKKCLKNDSFKQILKTKNINIIFYSNLLDLRNKIKIFEIDLIHATYYDFLLKFTTKKIVYTFHDAAPERFVLRYLRRLYIFKIFVRALCFVLADSINFVSNFSFSEYQYFYKFILKLFPNKFYSVAGNFTSFDNPILAENKISLKTNKVFSISFIGMRSFYKNFFSSIISIKMLEERKKNISFSINIIGGGKLSKKEKIILDNLNINYSHYLDISNYQINEILLKTNLLIHPSFYEGFGITVLEAMSLKVPVLAVDIPAVREFAKNSIFYSKNYSYISIYNALKGFLKTPNRSILKKIERAYSISKKYSWDEVAKKHYFLYKKTLKD